MPAIPDITLRSAATITPEDSIMVAARLMNELNVGALPVCDGDAVVGMVTDRDIMLHATARGRAPRSMAVAEVMRWNSEELPAALPQPRAGDVAGPAERAARSVGPATPMPSS